jgi:hypothetical protein
MNSGSEAGSPWTELGIAPTADMGEIRRAYARRLKAIDTAADPAGFQRLRQAYEAALGRAAGGQGATAPPPEAAPQPQAPPRAPGAFAAEIAEFTALGRREEIGAAMALVDRLQRRSALALEDAAALEGGLFSAAIDDPEMPPVLLAELARRFRWNEVGSPLEQYCPELYNRYLYRVGSAHAWLNRLNGLAQRIDIIGVTARTLLLRYSNRIYWLGIGAYDGAVLADLVRDARRFAPLLGDAIDPRMLAFLRRVVRGTDRESRRARLRLGLMVGGGALVALFALVALQAWLVGSYRPPDAKAMLNSTVEHWLVFHARPEDRNLIVYFSHLMGYRGAIAEIRYGVDSESPDKVFDFPFDDDVNSSPISTSVPTLIEVPRKTRFMSLQLRFKDGSSSPIRRYDVPADPSKYY